MKLLLLTVILLLIIGCVSEDEPTQSEYFSGRLVYAGQDCGGNNTQRNIQIIYTQEQWQTLQQKLPDIAKMIETADVDFSEDLLIQINMGMKRTGGYQLRTMETEDSYENGWVKIQLQWLEPGKDMMLTQAVTSPCIIKAIPRHNYQGIRVIDQNDELKIERPIR